MTRVDWSKIKAMTVTKVFCILLCVYSAALVGCQRQPDPQRFVPKEEVARTALEAVLNSWVEGQPVGLIPNTSPQVHITDSHRKQGQKLKSYRILGEVPGNAPRCFAVKLTFSNPAAEERVRFAILGIDPLWVFRHEDLDMLSHWEHPMEDVKKNSLGPSKTQPTVQAKPGPQAESKISAPKD